MTAVTRRSFLATLGAGLAAAPGLLRAQSRSARYPIAFSTLGCPPGDWKTILENADRHGFMALELRGIAGEMDLPKVPEFVGSRLADAKRDLAALGLDRERPRRLRAHARKGPGRSSRSSSTRAGASSTSRRRWACGTSGCSATGSPRASRETR